MITDPTRESPPPGGDSPATLRYQRLLARAESDPTFILHDRRCAREGFLEDFLRTCDTKALEAPPLALDYARAGVDLARRLGNRHLLNLSLGVQVHALVATCRYREAEQTAAGYLSSAMGCCRECLLDWFRRLADVMLETGCWTKAQTFLDLAFRISAEDALQATVPHLHFLRTIVRYGREDPAGALADADRVLEHMPLTEAQGYFIDTLAFMAKILQYAPPVHRRHALEILLCFKKRLKYHHLPAVRARLLWVEGLLHGLLVDCRRAVARLDAARNAHTRGLPVSYLVALSLDLAMLHCLRGDHPHRRTASRLLYACATHDELRDERLREGLQRTIGHLRGTGSRAFDELVRLRDSFSVPVPGLLGSVDRWRYRSRRRWNGRT